MAALAPRARADDLVQAPELAAPQRGSVAGEYAGWSLGAADNRRGAFALPGPFHAPEERGAPGAAVFPSYSPDAGLGEWGMGWSVALSVTRARPVGDLDYASDERTGPWGRMLQGSDGAWYPLGLSPPVRVVESGDTLTAYLPDGARWTFGGGERFTSARGTYAWYLTDVVTAIGRKTHLAWQHNDSGRRFVSTVSYGGAGDDTQYEIDFDYQPIPLLFVSWAAGAESTLDRRVARVTVRVRADGGLVERWHDDVSYREDGLGPAFYLAEVDRVYAAGDRDPPVRYAYRLAADQIGARAFVRLPLLDPILSTYGQDVIQPKNSALLDSDNDGRVDFEEHQGNALIQQSDSGYQVVPLPPLVSTALSACRRAASRFNTPRLLAQMRQGDDATYVVALHANAVHSATTLDLCTRDGTKLYEQVLTGYWEPSKTVRLADVDRDQQPDLVSIGYGQYSIIRNHSTDGGFAFDAAVTGTLHPLVTPAASWVQDMNGDGLVDLVARTSTQVIVWFGAGDLSFAGEGQVLDLRTRSGTQLGQLDQYAFNFVDANKDGLADLLLTKGSFFFLFINNGYGFQELPVAALDSLDPLSSQPVVADLGGGGNSQIVVTRGGLAYALDLDDAGVGLLSSADDGKGTVVRVAYGRGPAAPGGRTRHAVVAQVTIESSGSEAITASYGYQGPRTHSRGRYFLGYDVTTRQDPLRGESQSFLNDDDLPGLPLSTRATDALLPALVRVSERQYQAAVFLGVPWMRLASERRGWSDGATQSIDERVDYLDYAADFCPANVRATSRWGTLTTTQTRAALPALSTHLHCFIAGTVRSASHADPSLDTREEVRFGFDDAAAVTAVTAVAPDGSTWLRQTIVYNPDHTIAALTRAEAGTARFSYDAATHLLLGVQNGDGTVTTAVRDPHSDRVTAVTEAHGALSHVRSFSFDGQERLASLWDSLGGSSAATPLSAFSYRYATATQPAAVGVANLVDAGSVSRALELRSAGDQPVAKARELPGGWAFDELSARRPALGETTTSLRPALAGGDPAALDYTGLFNGAQAVGDQRDSSFGLVALRSTTFHAGVTRSVATTAQLAAGLVVVSDTENGQFTITRALDAAQRLVTRTEADGTRYGYHYDALGRLRVVDLPDGSHQRVDFDGYGRVARVARDGLRTTEYSYDAASGLVSWTRESGGDGVAARAVAFTYDGAGRKLSERHVDLVGGGSTVFNYYYDGATPAAPTVTATPGLLTATSGDGFVKLMQYRADGKLARRTVMLAGWRSVDDVFEYNAAGEARGNLVTVSDGTGAVLSQSHLAQSYDAYGQVAQVTLDGQPLATLAYDDNGQPASASFADGASLSWRYDGLSRLGTGFAQATAAFTTDESYRHDARGHLGAQQIGFGNATVMRSYGYSARGLLTSSSDAATSYVYGYDALGQLDHIEDAAGARTFDRSGDTLTAGSTVYQFDALGRTVVRGDLALAYGPNGQVASAQRGASAWTFQYDESGQRLVKLSGGAPVAAYLPEGYLDGTGLVTPVRVAGTLVGVLHGGAFVMLPVDHRGSTLGDGAGPAFASPYGDRATHPQWAAAIDYVAKGYDADLGVVRMGVRDYDPAIGRFLSPDPLFLTETDLARERPIETGLYGYASGDPLLNSDPSGEVTMGEGSAVHDAIGKKIVAEWQQRERVAFANYHSISQIIGGGPAALVDLLRLKPDITVVIAPGVFAIAEIKPVGSELQAVAEASLYLVVFNVAGSAAIPLPLDSPGMEGTVTVRGKTYYYYSPVPGVIIYDDKEIKNRWKPSPETVPNVLHARALRWVLGAAGAGALLDAGLKALGAATGAGETAAAGVRGAAAAAPAAGFLVPIPEGGFQQYIFFGSSNAPTEHY